MTLTPYRRLVSVVADTDRSAHSIWQPKRQAAIDQAEAAVEAIQAAVENDPSLSIVPAAWQRHVVELEEDDFFLEHSLDCRVTGLRNCPIHAALSVLDEAPQPPGRYCVELVSDALMFEGVA